MINYNAWREYPYVNHALSSCGQKYIANWSLKTFKVKDQSIGQVNHGCFHALPHDLFLSFPSCSPTIKPSSLHFTPILFPFIFTNPSGYKTMKPSSLHLHSKSFGKNHTVHPFLLPTKQSLHLAPPLLPGPTARPLRRRPVRLVPSLGGSGWRRRPWPHRSRWTPTTAVSGPGPPGGTGGERSGTAMRSWADIGTREYP